MGSEQYQKGVRMALLIWEKNSNWNQWEQRQMAIVTNVMLNEAVEMVTNTNMKINEKTLHAPNTVSLKTMADIVIKGCAYSKFQF